VSESLGTLCYESPNAFDVRCGGQQPQNACYEPSVRLCNRAGKIAEDPLNCAIIAREVGAIHQLILMALSENEVVVEQACKTIGTHCTAMLHRFFPWKICLDWNVLSAERWRPA
jgi:hypothetical protein